MAARKNNYCLGLVNSCKRFFKSKSLTGHLYQHENKKTCFLNCLTFFQATKFRALTRNMANFRVVLKKFKKIYFLVGIFPGAKSLFLINPNTVVLISQPKKIDLSQGLLNNTTKAFKSFKN